MYSRWQPGLLFALSIVLLFATLAQYGVQRTTYRSELARISRFQRAARLAAYGPKPSSSSSTERKKVRVPIHAGRADAEVDEDEEGSSAATGSRAARRAAAAGGAKGKKQAAGAAMVTMVVEGEQVWILTEDNQGPVPALHSQSRLG